MSTVTLPGPAASHSWGSTLAWVLAGVPAFAVGWASSSAMGEVIGEAWGGDLLHALGHALGTVLLMALVSLAGWLALRRRVTWASRWTLAATLGVFGGSSRSYPCWPSHRTLWSV